MTRTKRTPRRRAPTARVGLDATSVPEALPDEQPALPLPEDALLSPSPEPAGEHEPVTPLATPEVAFAARVAPPTPEQPLPANRRAIFYDVENASQPGRIAQVVELLAIDRLGCRTEFVAVGNWRVIGHETARMLARHGAQLVHSAPSTGVRDWSDLRIAVSAGAWLAAARPGDVLEIVSDDRAFDAVGDVAAGLGIAFRRLSSRSLTHTPDETAREALPSQALNRRTSRGRRGRRSPRAGRTPVVTVAEPRRADTRGHDPLPPAGAHTAPHDEIIDIVRELAQRSSNGAVLIDTIERTLKSRGFSRPPGSPRLVTRLRRIKELSVSSTGMITLVGEPTPAEAVGAAAADSPVPGASPGRRRRRSRRGGRGRRRAAPGGQASTS
jgi:hypothetical protein